jgi:hypothetical protein
VQHPAQFFIKYLLSSNSHTFDEVAAIMEMYGLGGVTRSYLTTLQTELFSDKPAPFRPRTRTHRPSQSWLRKHGIYKAWHRDAAMECAMSIVCTPRVKALAETFILSPVSEELAVAKIQDVEPDFYITVSGYDKFRHYFWNPKLLSGAEWGEFIDMRDASHNHWLCLAVNARGPEGVQLLLWKSGVGALKNLDRAKIFTDFRNIAYMKAKELEAAPACVDDSKALLNYARVARSAQEEVNNSSDAVNDILEGFNAFCMKRKEISAPSVKQLTGGSFTPAEDIVAVEDKIEY